MRSGIVGLCKLQQERKLRQLTLFSSNDMPSPDNRDTDRQPGMISYGSSKVKYAPILAAIGVGIRDAVKSTSSLAQPGRRLTHCVAMSHPNVR